MSRCSIYIGSNKRKLFLMFANNPDYNFSNMNPYLNIQILVLFGTPLEHLGLIQHLLSHSKQSFYLIPSDHLVLHLTLDLLYARSCHIRVTHSLYLLHCETRTQFVELSIQIIQNSHHVSALLFNYGVEIAHITEKYSHAVLPILSSLFTSLRKEIPDKFRH